MRLVQVFCVVLLQVFLVGCAGTKLIDKPVVLERQEFKAPEIPPASLNRFEWTISSPTLWCVSPEGYKAIMNNEKIERDQIIRRNDIIDGYKQYYAPTSIKTSK